MLYEALHELSILQWINVRLGPGIVFSGTMDKLLQLQVPKIHPGLVDIISNALIAGHVQNNQHGTQQFCKTMVDIYELGELDLGVY